MEYWYWSILGILVVFLVILLYKYITKKPVPVEVLEKGKKCCKMLLGIPPEGEEPILPPCDKSYHLVYGAYLALAFATGQIPREEYEKEFKKHIKLAKIELK